LIFAKTQSAESNVSKNVFTARDLITALAHSDTFTSYDRDLFTGHQLPISFIIWWGANNGGGGGKVYVSRRRGGTGLPVRGIIIARVYFAEMIMITPSRRA